MNSLFGAVQFALLKTFTEFLQIASLIMTSSRSQTLGLNILTLDFASLGASRFDADGVNDECYADGDDDGEEEKDDVVHVYQQCYCVSSITVVRHALMSFYM